MKMLRANFIAAAIALTALAANAAGKVARVTRVNATGPESAEAQMLEAVESGNIARFREIASRGLSVNTPICIAENARRGAYTIATKDLLRGYDLQPASAGEGDFRERFYAVYPKAANAKHPYGWARFYGTPLMAAARAGNAKMVEMLLAAGANPNVFIEMKTGGEDYSNALSRPCMYALAEAYFSDGKSESPRMAARREKCARLLLKAGAYFAPADGRGRNALWDAAETGSVFLAKEVLACGVDANARDGAGRSAADYVALTGGGREELVEYLVSRGAEPSKLQSGDCKTLPPPEEAIARLENERVEEERKLAAAAEATRRMIADLERQNREAERESRMAEMEAEEKMRRTREEMHEQEMARVKGQSVQQYRVTKEMGLESVAPGGPYSWGGRSTSGTIYKDSAGDLYKVDFDGSVNKIIP